MIYLTTMPQSHPRGRRVRASKPKVRTGCVTCKLRRVKCDEAKPYCLRCQKFGVLCEGYAPIPPKSNSNTTSGTNSLANSPPDSGKSLKLLDLPELSLQHPSFQLFADDQQCHYYQVFCDQTSHSLSGFYDADLWGRLILQACHQEEFVKHAVVALGALDQTMDVAQQFKEGFSVTGVDIATSLDVNKQRVLEHHEYALQHYNKSIALMRQGLSDDNTDERQLRNLLISCLLIVCFEIYHGNMNAALFQAQIGINLLTEWLRNCPVEGRGLAIAGITSPKPHVIEDELVQAFARLERQCMTFLSLDIERSREVVRECFHAFKNIPERFSSLKEARAYFFLLDRFSSHSTVLAQARGNQHAVYSQVAYRWFGQRGKQMAEGAVPLHISGGQMPDILRQGLKAHQAAFARWIHAFEPILEKSRTSEGSDDYLGATILHMRSKVNVLSGLRAFTDEVSFHERYLQDFIEIVTLSKEVLELSSQSQSARRTRFMFDANVIGMLFFLTNFVRHRLVRRQAVELLEAYPGREGAWDSAMAATLARWNIHMEEQGLPDDVVYVPESRKIHMLNLESSLAERKMTIDYYMPQGASGEEQELHREELTW